MQVQYRIKNVRSWLQRRSLATLLTLSYTTLLALLAVSLGTVYGVATFRRLGDVAIRIAQAQADQLAQSISSAVFAELSGELRIRSQHAAAELAPRLAGSAPDDAGAIAQRYVSEHAFADGGYLFVIDRAGRVIAHPRPHIRGRSIARYGFVSQLLAGAGSSVIYGWDDLGRAEPHTKVASAAPLPVDGWFLAASHHAHAATERLADGTLERLLASVQTQNVIAAALIHDVPHRHLHTTESWIAVAGEIQQTELWATKRSGLIQSDTGPWHFLAFAPTDDLGGMVAVYGALSAIATLSRTYSVMLASSVLVALILIAVLSRGVALLITRPLNLAVQRISPTPLPVAPPLPAQQPLSLPRAARQSGNEVMGIVRHLLRARARLDRERHAREKLQAELQVAESAFMSSHEGICVAYPDGRILRANPAFEEITGYWEAQARRMSHRDFLSARHDEEFYEELTRSLRANGRWSGEVWTARPDGTERPYLLSITAIRDTNEVLTNFVAIFQDLGRIQEIQARLHHLATHDPLTALPNRVLLDELLETTISEARRSEMRPAVLFLDLNDFKLVNDSLGHEAGDRLLQLVAARILDELRGGDRLFRFGGDEFVVLVRDSADSSELTAIASRLLRQVARPFTIGSQQVRTSLSIGIAHFASSGVTPAELLKNADAAMYVAKRGRAGGYEFHDPTMTREAAQRLEMQTAVLRGLGEGQFHLALQPIVSLRSEEVIAAEALIRWRRNGSTVAPGEFLPFLERSEAMRRLDSWVVAQACCFLNAASPRLPAGFTLSVNVSPRELTDAAFVDSFLAIIDEGQVSRSLLRLEVTESVAIADFRRAADAVRRLTDEGIGVYLDDFGEGYASLRSLRDLGATAVKLDRSYMANVERDEGARSLVRGFLELARGMGLSAVLEGIETGRQLEFAREAGASLVQGYAIGRPVEAAQVETQLLTGGFPRVRANPVH